MNQTKRMKRYVMFGGTCSSNYNNKTAHERGKIIRAVLHIPNISSEKILVNFNLHDIYVYMRYILFLFRELWITHNFWEDEKKYYF